MNKAIIGRKVGMTQLFTPEGKVIPVTVVEAGPCPVVQIKTIEKDGYCAVKREFRVENAASYEVGKTVTAETFKAGDHVDVVGTSKGHGFSGVIKRWNQRRLKETHGVGPVHREVGSMGANSTPSRVFKQKHMPGQYGHERVTVQNLEVVRVDAARNALLIKGAIPGPKGSIVTVCDSVKAK